MNYSRGIDKTPYSELEKAVLDNNPGADRKVLRDAFDLAKKAHALQKRDEGCPYFEHPYRVALYLAEKMNVGDEKIIATALLHDVLEDSKSVTAEDLEKKFGDEVAQNVKTLSKPKIGGSMTIEKRDEIYHKRIENAPLELKYVKIADRLDNVRSLHFSPDPEKRKSYAIETHQVYLPLAMKYFRTAAIEMENILSKYS